MEESSIGFRKATTAIPVNHKKDLNILSGIDVLQSDITYNNGYLNRVFGCVGARYCVVAVGSGTSSTQQQHP